MSILWLRLQFCLLELYIKQEEKKTPFTRVSKRGRFEFLTSFVVSFDSVFLKKPKKGKNGLN